MIFWVVASCSLWLHINIAEEYAASTFGVRMFMGYKPQDTEMCLETGDNSPTRTKNVGEEMKPSLG
jgi:hypothetical protein